MTQSIWTAIIAVVAVTAVSLALRRGVSRPPTVGPSVSPEPEPADEDSEPDDEGSPEIAAITSDGWSFVPVGDREKVQLLPPPTPEEETPPGGRRGREQLGRGDLIAARVTRGAPDHDPWRLEALGRDHEYRAWRFETEEAARAALALVTERVVRAPRDGDGEMVSVGEAEFAAARRQEEEIERELASLQEADEESGPPLGR